MTPPVPQIMWARVHFHVKYLFSVYIPYFEENKRGFMSVCVSICGCPSSVYSLLIFEAYEITLLSVLPPYIFVLYAVRVV
jgi:hypothetical protein